MAARTGFEPVTNRLTVDDSTAELQRNIKWMGKRDSNPRMTGPKPVALPLGDTPMFSLRGRNYRHFSQICQVFRKQRT